MEMALPLATEKVSVPSSFMVCAAGTVFTGASLTALTVMATVSVSVWAPPEPVLPWSLVVTVRLAVPLKLPVGWNTRPLRAVLMLASVPVTVTVPVPLPLTVRPEVPARVSTPLVTASVTWTLRAAGVDVGDGDGVAVGDRERQRAVLVHGLGGRHRVDRRVVDGVDGDGDGVGVGLSAAGAGVALVVGGDRQVGACR